MDFNTKYRAIASVSSLNIMTNRRTEYGVCDAVVSFLLRKKKPTEKSKTRRWNIQVACKRKYATFAKFIPVRQIAPGGGFVDGWPGRAGHGLR